jgi:hypothetical protein
MISATAAGSPEKKTVQPPRTPAQASRPLTIEVPSEGSVSQRMWMTAWVGIATNLRRDCDETDCLRVLFLVNAQSTGFRSAKLARYRSCQGQSICWASSVGPRSIRALYSIGS